MDRVVVLEMLFGLQDKIIEAVVEVDDDLGEEARAYGAFMKMALNSPEYRALSSHDNQILSSANVEMADRYLDCLTDSASTET